MIRPREYRVRAVENISHNPASLPIQDNLSHEPTSLRSIMSCTRLIIFTIVASAAPSLFELDENSIGVPLRNKPLARSRLLM